MKIFKITNGSGLHMKKVSAKNRIRVKNWFKENPGETMTACMKALKLSAVTVRRHIRAIRDEV